MRTFRIVTIPFYFFVAAIDLAAGITRLTQGATETGVLYLTLAVLFATFAVEKIDEARSAE